MRHFRTLAGTLLIVALAAGLVALQRGTAQSQAKAPVYFVVENEIHDVQSYLKEYAPRAREMIKANGGRYLAAGDATTFMGEPPKSRIAIFAFDDMKQIQTWLDSTDYKELKKIGEKYANFRGYAVPGVP